jgi:REP element-mobilizing transposase RayT
MQIELDLRPRTWGGKRAGAGRPKKLGRREPMHRVRPYVPAYHPIHIVLRVRKDVGRLRKRPVYEAAHAALWHSLQRRNDFRLVHISIQHNHVHLLVEIETRESLIRGMQGLAITLARRINRSLGRRGKVFAFRYHATEICSRKQARHALAYVLNNWRRHREDLASCKSRAADTDPYSSGSSFHSWSRAPRDAWPGYAPLPVSAARTWLLVEGWQVHGLIDPREVPCRTRTDS